MNISSIYSVLLNKDVVKLSELCAYRFKMAVNSKSDWYVSLSRQGKDCIFQPAILKSDHSTIPEGFRDESWGQRHFITSDPDNNLLDIIEPIQSTGEFFDLFLSI